MEKTAFLFSGQGSQYAGMGSELCRCFREAARVYEMASETLGLDVLKLSSEGSEAELSRTVVSQPLIFTLSMAAFEVLRANGVLPDAVAGFSLGECSAFSAAGAMPLETGLRLIKERSRAMQRAAEQTDGSMYAVIGPDAEKVDEACFGTEGYVVPVNYNCPGQIVIAGEARAAEAAAETLKNSGARVVKLAVNAAFHSLLMKDAAEAFYAAVKNYEYAKPAVPVYSNVTGGLFEGGSIPEYLKTQMTSPVRFADELAAMRRGGIGRFVELGPGRTLCGLVRKTLKGVPFMNMEDEKTARNCIAALTNRES